MKATVIVPGDPCAPIAVTVTCPVYVPAVKFPRIAVIVIMPGAVPFAGTTVSQGESLPVEKFSAPPPEFVAFTICGAGSFAIPNTPLKESIVCDKDRVGVPPFPPPPPHAERATQRIPAIRTPQIRFMAPSFSPPGEMQLLPRIEIADIDATPRAAVSYHSAPVMFHTRHRVVYNH